MHDVEAEPCCMALDRGNGRRTAEVELYSYITPSCGGGYGGTETVVRPTTLPPKMEIVDSELIGTRAK